jgi:hypothetical protein
MPPCSHDMMLARLTFESARCSPPGLAPSASPSVTSLRVKQRATRCRTGASQLSSSTARHSAAAARWSSTWLLVAARASCRVSSNATGACIAGPGNSTANEAGSSSSATAAQAAASGVGNACNSLQDNEQHAGRAGPVSDAAASLKGCFVSHARCASALLPQTKRAVPLPIASKLLLSVLC